MKNFQFHHNTLLIDRESNTESSPTFLRYENSFSYVTLGPLVQYPNWSYVDQIGPRKFFPSEQFFFLKSAIYGGNQPGCVTWTIWKTRICVSQKKTNFGRKNDRDIRQFFRRSFWRFFVVTNELLTALCSSQLKLAQSSSGKLCLKFVRTFVFFYKSQCGIFRFVPGCW